MTLLESELIAASAKEKFQSINGDAGFITWISSNQGKKYDQYDFARAHGRRTGMTQGFYLPRKRRSRFRETFPYTSPA